MIKAKPLIEKMWRPEPDTSQRYDYYRFDRNERTTLFTDDQFSSIISTLSPYDLVAYGELELFYKKICSWLGVNRDNILLTSGSDAGIRAVYETYVSEGNEVITTLPNYAMFSAYAAMFGANEVQYFYDKNLSLDSHGLIKNISDKTRLVIISNPGHTGTIISIEDLTNIIKAAAKCDTLVLIDEAYYHFYSGTVIGLINNFENIIISRTFSKAFGLPSIRIGLIIGNRKRINEVYKVKPVHEITGLAAKIGIYFLEHMEIVDQYVDNVNRGKEVLYSRLKNFNFNVLKSEANFIFFKPPKNLNAVEIMSHLEENHILIKGPFEKPPFDNHLRITVGDEQQMNMFCDSIENFIKK